MTYYGAKELAESFRTVRKNTILVDNHKDAQGTKERNKDELLCVPLCLGVFEG